MFALILADDGNSKRERYSKADIHRISHGERASEDSPNVTAILETIYSIDGHFDIDMLYSRMMDQENFRVSRATLYNTIILLINARLIIKHQFGTSSQYEKSYNRETHHHQICTQCGKVTEFQNEELQQAIENTKLSRFQLSHYSLYIYGVCSKCDRANKRKKSK